MNRMTKQKDAKFLTRRRFMIGVSGVSVGLPLLSSIGSGPALAQEGASTPRFLNFHCSSGVDDERFWPGIGALSEGAFAGTGMEPIGRYAARMLIPRGVHGYPVGTWTGHLEGTIQALTAAAYDANEIGMGTSIEQLIARQVSGKEALVLRPGGPDEGVPAFNSISYTGPGQLVAPQTDPARAYRGMVGLSVPSTDADTAGADLVAQRRTSVLDMVRAEFEDLKALNLSSDDRQKLDQHFELIRDVETASTGAELIGCNLDTASTSDLENLDPERVEANENFPLAARLHAKIAALALACGHSQSVTLQWGAAVAGSPMYQWDGINHQYRHHPLSHGTTGDTGGDTVGGYRDMLYEIDRWNMKEFAALLDLLDSYTEAGGRTLLDNTVVLYTNEFSNGQGHTTGDLPIAIVGGSGYFKQGESIVVGGSSADIAGESSGNSNRMLATILASVGVSQDGFSGGPAEEFGELRA
jgi:hypothetical protein